MAQNPLTAVLAAPSVVPLYLRRFAIAVDYVAEPSEENREVLEDSVSDFEGALQLGFFAWASFPQRQAARLTVEWLEQGFVLHGETEGVHHNVLVALLRMLVRLNHTPSEAHASAVAALGEDASALPPPVVFSETIKSVRVEGLEGLDARVSGRTDFDRFIVDDQIAAVDGAAFSDLLSVWEGDRIVLATREDIGADDFDAIEDSFLRMFDIGCFLGLDTIEEMAGDPEFFLRDDGDQTELLVDDYDGESYGLIELLNVVSRGRVSIFSAAEESVD